MKETEEREIFKLFKWKLKLNKKQKRKTGSFREVITRRKII